MHEPPLILAVDDLPDNLEILRLRLESQGYEVITAADGGRRGPTLFSST
jgi:adenylate cyclase